MIPSLVFLADPDRFTEPLYMSHEDLLAMDFEYEPDPFMRLIDVARKPSTTLDRNSGDCMDWVRLCYSVLQHEGRDPDIYLFITPRWPPLHAIVYDGEYVYSNGNVLEMTPEEYKEQTDRRWMIRR